jgi:hypothetical protein
MSAPPIQPLMNTCGSSASPRSQTAPAGSPDRVALTAVIGAPARVASIRALGLPHMAGSGVPFMKSATGSLSIVLDLVSLSLI